MAFLKSHQSLARHPRTVRLMHALGVDRLTAIGLLHMLWWWALDYAEDGDLSGFSAAELADAAEWDGDPDAFVDGLSAAGFLEDGRLHDWMDYVGQLVGIREGGRQAAHKRWHVRRNVTNPGCSFCLFDSPLLATHMGANAGASAPDAGANADKTRQDKKTPVRRKAAARARDPIHDALAEIEGADPLHLTRPHARTIGVAAADIRRATPDVSPEEVNRRAEVYRRQHPTWELTAPALAKHWASLVPKKTHVPDGRCETCGGIMRHREWCDVAPGESR